MRKPQKAKTDILINTYRTNQLKSMNPFSPNQYIECNKNSKDFNTEKGFTSQN